MKCVLAAMRNHKLLPQTNPSWTTIPALILHITLVRTVKYKLIVNGLIAVKCCLLGCDTMQPGKNLPNYTAEMEVLGSTQTMVNFYQTARRHIIEDIFFTVTAIRSSHMFNRCFSSPQGKKFSRK
jgi:hypothetical protein